MQGLCKEKDLLSAQSGTPRSYCVDLVLQRCFGSVREESSWLRAFCQRSCESCAEDRESGKTWEIGREFTHPSTWQRGNKPALAVVLNVGSASLHGVELNPTSGAEESQTHTCLYTGMSFYLESISGLL